MSFLTPVTRTQITGLTALTWNTVSLGSFVSIPTGATGVILEFNTNSVGAAWGAQKAGSSEDAVHTAEARLRTFRWMPIVGGQVELYTSNTTNGAWWIVGYENHVNWLATPIEKGGVAGAGTYTLDYSTDLPTDAANGIAIFELSANVKIGEVGNTALQPRATVPADRATVAVKLNASRQCQFVSTGAVTNAELRVVGWAKAGSYIPETTWPVKNSTVINTWEDTTNVRTSTVWDDWRLHVASDNILWGARTKGSTFNDTDTNSKYRIVYVEPSDPEGKIQLFSANLANEYYLYGGWVPTLAPSDISGIDQLISGQTSTVTFSNPAFAATSVSISDGAVTKTAALTYVSAGVYTFTAPSWVDGATGLKYGSVTVTGSDGTESTSTFADIIDPPTGLAVQNITSVATGNYLEGYVPPLKIGSQVLYNPAQVYIYDSGILENVGGFSGDSVIGDRDPDDSITRIGTFTISGGGSGDSGGLTSSGLTSSGLTRAGLTSAGL